MQKVAYSDHVRSLMAVYNHLNLRCLYAVADNGIVLFFL